MDILSTNRSNARHDEQLYRQWFDYADAGNDGRLTGDDTVKFFSLSQLPRADLKQVWAIADVKRQGFLGFKEFVSAMQVISLAQSGKDLSPNMLRNADLDSISAPTVVGLEELIEKRQQRTSPSSNGSFRSNGPSPQKSQTSQWFNQSDMFCSAQRSTFNERVDPVGMSF
ncbi:hypothetical protein KC19_12G174300 [Ceratodon purpureus]|uniref:Uncharacterized protein n=1 Tax=Ceratodon purpureus TaxID=3225 RepID=A0A8T0G8V6_CERPU|nr:hypothetical protein KC19_12G174300 [Ceratodon purpureus]